MTKKEISNYYTDESITRLVATQVVVILLFSFFDYGVYLSAILAIDFALRAFTYLPSPLALIAKLAFHSLKLSPKPIFAPPKKFAALVGFIFSLTILVLLLLNYSLLASTVSMVLIFFAFLEAVFRICVGCYVYSWLIAPMMNQ